MARAAITKTQLGGYYPTTLTAITWTTANATDKEYFVADSENIVLVWNTSTDTDYSVTVNSTADPATGRTGDITAVDVPFGTIRAFRVRQSGWIQSGSDAGKVFCEAENADIKWAVLTP